MEVSLRDLDKHKILVVSGAVDLYNVGDLKDAVANVLAEDLESLIIDMGGISYMDSSGIGVLVSTKKKIIAKGGKFALMNMQDSIFYILKLATLDQFFTIYKDESEIQI